MGILSSAISIALGSIFGDKLKSRIPMQNITILGISVMLISLVGMLENVFTVSEHNIKSSDLIIVVLALLAGSLIGEAFKIDKLLSGPRKKDTTENPFYIGTMFFAVGGLQITGPLMLSLNNDNSQLFIKSLIDFPFAFALGATYGKKIAFSALPVAIMQFGIYATAFPLEKYLVNGLVEQICAIGYIILFFTGFNLVCDKKYKINTTNMLPAIIVVILFNCAVRIWR